MGGKPVRKLESGEKLMDSKAKKVRSARAWGLAWMCELREREETWRKPSLWLGVLQEWMCHSWDREGRRRSHWGLDVAWDAKRLSEPEDRGWGIQVAVPSWHVLCPPGPQS